MKCCNKPKSERPDDCIPIPVPRDDPFWSTKTGINTTCMELRRSMAVDENQCGMFEPNNVYVEAISFPKTDIVTVREL